MPSTLKTRIALCLVALLALVTAMPSSHAQTETSDTRLAQLVEANVIAVHAFQVLLAKNSGKGQACFSPGTLSDAALNALSEHQAKLLKSDPAQLRLWVEGAKSSFDPAADLEPILSSGLKIP